MHTISYIFFLRDHISRRFEVTAKKTRLQNKKVGCCGNVPWKFEGFKSFIYSHSGTERWNRVKIRPVEVEIIGLTEIVKKRKIQKQNKWLSGSLLRRRWVAKQCEESNK